MTLDQNQGFVPTRSDDQRAIYGKLNTALKKGNFVQYKDNGAGSNEGYDARELEPAEATSGFFLTRDCVAADEDKRLAEAVHGTQKHFANDFIVGESTVTGRKLHEGVFEGADFLDVSITNALAAGTPVTFKAGKPSVITDSEEVVGHIRAQLTPTVGGAARVKIEFKS